MSPILTMLRDRKRSQRGSVLSGVLIITAFLAIIAGALTTELSANFLLSRNLATRVNNEATVQSAVELALDQLQNTPLNQPCPSPSPVSLNGATAAVTYISCKPVVDVRSPQFMRIPSSNGFSIDGTHVQLTGLNDYVVADSGGTVFDYRFGTSTPRWTLALGGTVTGIPLVMPDPNGQYLDLIPLSGPSCAPSTFCVNAVADTGSTSAPSSRCTMAAGGVVAAQPGAGSAFPDFAYTSEGNGFVNALDLTTSYGTCDVESSTPVSGAAVGRVAVFACSGCGKRTDEIYVLTNASGSSELTWLTYTSTQGLRVVSTLSLPWGNASGLVVDKNSVPARLAISFAGGGVAIVQIASNGTMSLNASALLPGSPGIGDAPYWCNCPSLGDLIGVGTQSGVLYLLDPGLSTVATFTAGAAISTTPGVDGAGNWYFGADDGFVYEVQVAASQPAMTLAKRYGPMGGFGSSVQVGGCTAGICVYAGSLNSSLYMVSLDARDVVMSACLSGSPPTCSGTNPRLWTSVEVGDAVSPATVHVQGWSYYSP